jgi:hypothetical protein
MKKKQIIFAFGLLLAGGIALCSCTKNEDNTIALIGTEYYIDDILSVIPDSLQTRFFVEFGSIPEGPIPPKIDGSYVMNPKQRVYSNDPIWNQYLHVVENNIWLRFSNQHNGIFLMDLKEASETVTDTVFVCGAANAFAVYFVENKEYELPYNGQIYHERVKRGIIMKGEVTSEGLSDFRYATIILESEDDSNGTLSQYPNGSYFIYKDGDGLASNEEW